MSSDNHSPSHVNDFYYSMLTRIDAKLDNLMRTSASVDQVQSVEIRVRELENNSASRKILDRIAWFVVGLMATGNLIFQGMNHLL